MRLISPFTGKDLTCEYSAVLETGLYCRMKPDANGGYPRLIEGNNNQGSDLDKFFEGVGKLCMNANA